MPGLSSVSTNMSAGSSLGENQGYSYNYADSQGTSASNSNANASSFQDPGLLARYDQQYSTAIQQQNANYDRILGGYSDILGRTGTAADRIATGYGDLNRQIQGRIGGTFAGRRQDINDQYAMAGSQANQSLISRGLGNTTVKDSVGRGMQYDKQKALTSLAGQEAQLGAGYDMQTGSAGLGAYSQAMGIGGSLGASYLGDLAGYRLQTPTWAPNVSQSTSTSGSNSQNTSHSQGESWNYGYNQSQNASQGYGASYPPPNRAQPTQYYPPSGGGQQPWNEPQWPVIPADEEGWGGGGSWDPDPPTNAGQQTSNSSPTGGNPNFVPTFSAPANQPAPGSYIDNSAGNSPYVGNYGQQGQGVYPSGYGQTFGNYGQSGQYFDPGTGTWKFNHA